MSEMDRRDFIKTLMALGVVTVIGDYSGKRIRNIASRAVQTTAQAPNLYSPAIKGAHYSMMIDVGACIG